MRPGAAPLRVDAVRALRRCAPRCPQKSRPLFRNPEEGTGAGVKAHDTLSPSRHDARVRTVWLQHCIVLSTARASICGVTVTAVGVRIARRNYSFLSPALDIQLSIILRCASIALLTVSRHASNALRVPSSQF